MLKKKNIATFVVTSVAAGLLATTTWAATMAIGQIDISSVVNTTLSDVNGATIRNEKGWGVITGDEGDFAGLYNQGDVFDVYNFTTAATPVLMYSGHGVAFTASNIVAQSLGGNGVLYTATGVLSDTDASDGFNFLDTLADYAFSFQNPVGSSSYVVGSITTVSPAAVPLPAGGLLMLTGLGGAAALKRCKKRAA